MAATTTLTVTPIVGTKRVMLEGAVAAGELVAVTAVGCQAYIAGGLRIRVRKGASEIARFPLEDGDTWVADGDNAICELNLNTVQSLALFTGRPDTATVSCIMVVEMTVASDLTLTAVSPITIHNWPKAVGDAVPYNLTGWDDDLDAVVSDVAALEAEFDAHAHTGADNSVVVSHTSLTEIGTKTHEELEAEDAALGVLVDGLDGDMTTAQASIVTNAGKIAGHAHTGADGSVAVSHASLADKGTLTHVQVEAAIEAVDDKADANAGLIADHAHTGSDGSAQIAASNLDGYAALLARLEAAEATVASQQAVIDALAATYLAIPVTANYTVTAPTSGEYRNIREDMTGDQLARCIPTIVQDLIDRGVL